ncbi:MAG: BamA/TamA family outer membrane protein [Flavobacteriales bacterium]
MICSLRTFSQTSDSLQNSLLAYPVGFYLPETGFGGGLAISYNFHLNKQDTISPASQVQLGIAYTQHRQVLGYLPFHFYWNERRHEISGEIGYNDYPYYYYGTFSTPQVHREKYDATYPLFRISYLRKIKSKIFIGPRFWFAHYNIQPNLEMSEMVSNNIQGALGGTTSGLGLVALFDSRDNIYYSEKGQFLELSFNNYSKKIGSDFDYNRYRFDYRFFEKIDSKNTIGIQVFGDFMNGNIPFYDMTGIGSNKRMRGYVEGRHRANNLILAQLEYRWHFHKRWGVTVFGSYAKLEDHISNLPQGIDYAAAGMGARYFFDIKKRITIRLDAAVGPHGMNYYFTIGESF